MAAGTTSRNPHHPAPGRQSQYPAPVQSVTVRQLVAASAVAVQAAVLFAPRAPSVDTGGLPVDKVVHFGVFAAATAAVIWAGGSTRGTTAVMAAYAPLSEVIQAGAYPQRSGEIADVVADLLGVAAGAWIGTRARGRDTQDALMRTAGDG